MLLFLYFETGLNIIGTALRIKSVKQKKKIFSWIRKYDFFFFCRKIPVIIVHLIVDQYEFNQSSIQVSNSNIVHGA